LTEEEDVDPKEMIKDAADLFMQSAAAGGEEHGYYSLALATGMVSVILSMLVPEIREAQIEKTVEEIRRAAAKMGRDTDRITLQ
jgi:hypothetical protein